MKEFVLITGATSGIGLEMAKIFAKNNYNLVLVGRNEDKLKELKDSFKNVEIEIFPLDLSKVSNIDILICRLNHKNITVDILINNAGAGFSGKFSKIDWENHENILDLNIKSLTKLTYSILEKMKANKKGKILNVASTGAYQPGPLTAVYYATKAYVLSFSSALREEVKGDNILISTLCPGATKTNFCLRAGKEDISVAMSPEAVARIAYKGLNRGKAIIIPGAMNKLLVFLSKISPTTINAKVVKRIQENVEKK